MGAGEVVCVELCCVLAFHARANIAGIVEGGGFRENVEASRAGGEGGDVPWIRKQVSWSWAMKMNIAYDTIYPLPSRI